MPATSALLKASTQWGIFMLGQITWELKCTFVFGQLAVVGASVFDKKLEWGWNGGMREGRKGI